MKRTGTMAEYTFNMAALEQAYSHSTLHVEDWYKAETCYNCESAKAVKAELLLNKMASLLTKKHSRRLIMPITGRAVRQ